MAATTITTQLLALFKKQRTHAALAVVEHGGTLGFVTLEDLIDEEEAAESD
ncbi:MULTISPECIES: hypothetical protein [Sphingobium]|uniref:hypothetical protein n=1 Tax=Sphingobium TaxID=165695 RepID=UPI000A600889|nr:MULTISPECIES: hypothetical protein [Sphingobium]WCP13776.1 hypothetical protein sphantq_02213 [Sphingobium sp. AntQ-1]